MLFHVLLAAALTLTAFADQQGLTVHTQQGDVTGTPVSPEVRRFVGIPYAVAGRWEAPQSPPTRTAPFKATEFGDSCPQALNLIIAKIIDLMGSIEENVPESDDCLSVNIWTPSIQRKQKTAVLIWIYGGSFQMGTSNSISTDGQHIVRDNDDVLVVSFNYRTNIFGQPNAPQLLNTNQTQNFGLLDIDAAIQWVHANIAAFGGDPDRITLFGQSAGGIAIDAYTYMRPNDNIVKGVIEQSGNLIHGNMLPINGSGIDPTPWNQIANAVGCGTSNDATQLNCMKAFPASKLRDAINNTDIFFNLMADNITLFTDYRDRAATGNFLRVPLLAGTVQHEADIIVVAQQELLLKSALPVITELLSDLQTQLVFTCSTSKTANDRLKASVPTWRYQYQAIFPDISRRPDLRAYHGSDFPLVFGTYDRSAASSAPVPPKVETALSKYIQRAWVAFARDPSHGLVKYGWPQYNPDTASLVQLGNFFNKSGAAFGEGGLLDLTCGAEDKLGDLLNRVTGLFDTTGS